MEVLWANLGLLFHIVPNSFYYKAWMGEKTIFEQETVFLYDSIGLFNALMFFILENASLKHEENHLKYTTLGNRTRVFFLFLSMHFPN